MKKTKSTLQGRTPYQKLMAAARIGKGIKLTANEVWTLSQDDAIETRAQLDDEEEVSTPKTLTD